MMIVIFRSKLVDMPAGYAEMADEMNQLARTMPGFVDVKSYTSEDGERLTVVWWENQEGLKAWRDQARHRVAPPDCRHARRELIGRAELGCLGPRAPSSQPRPCEMPSLPDSSRPLSELARPTC